MTNDSDELRLGTRGSQLALWQANTVARLLAERGGPSCRLVVIKTAGDRLQDAPLSEVGGKRLFVKEIEDALTREEIDLAVHSSKDMPAALLDDLAIAAVLPREDPRDAIVLPANAGSALDDGHALTALGVAPLLGTGSVRRIAQLKHLLPDARFAPIRGNLDTRLRKLDDGQYDALVLAAAGLRRLGAAHRISYALPTADCLPAPGQGIIAVEIRRGDARVRAAVERINDPAAATALAAERQLVAALGGGCQTPVAALASWTDAGDVTLAAAVFALDGSRAVRASVRGAAHEAGQLGARAAEQLLALGAAEILEEARRTEPVRPSPLGTSES